ncbi:MAG: helix-turn-helix domain-containing protein [Saprospiraceae bacterium]
MVFYRTNPKTANSRITMTDATSWLAELNVIIDKQIQRRQIDNRQIAREMGVSERQLFRKIKAYTKLAPRKYMRRYRIEKAMTYLQKGAFTTVNEVAFAVGYTNVGYFITQFEQRFDKRPLEVLKEYGWR